MADHAMDAPEEFYKQAGTSRLHSHDRFNPYTVKDNDIIFVKTDFIVDGTFERMFLDKIYKTFNLITGVSSYHIGRDGGDRYKNILSYPNLNKWICTNPPSAENKKIIPIPIGFEEPDRPAGNQEFLHRMHKDRSRFEDKKDMILLPYHTVDTNPNRNALVERLGSLPFVHVQKEKQSFEDYFNLLNQYKFVIGLEGSGPDIHRNYEAILVGSIPINKKNVIERVFSLHSASAVFLESWLDLTQDKFEKMLNVKYNFTGNDRFLKLENHISLIKGLI